MFSESNEDGRYKENLLFDMEAKNQTEK